MNNHNHLGFDDIENYMTTDSFDDFEEGFLDYFEECLDTCEDCQNRFRTWMFLDSLMKSILEDTSIDSHEKEQPAQRGSVSFFVGKYEYLNEESIGNIKSAGLPYNKLELRVAS